VEERYVCVPMQVCLTTMFGNLMKIFLVYLQEAEK
jgi:hypothetical protein